MASVWTDTYAKSTSGSSLGLLELQMPDICYFTAQDAEQRCQGWMVGNLSRPVFYHLLLVAKSMQQSPNFPLVSGETRLRSCLWFNISLCQMRNGVTSGFWNLPGNKMLFTVQNPK